MTKAIKTLIQMFGTAYSGRVRLGALRLAVLVAVAAAPCSVAHAQARPTEPDLTFPKQAKELGFFSPLEMGIWKPEGDGPFPALILVHTCAGLKQQLVYWRKEAVRRGYVAFIIDSFTPRGSSRCQPLPPVRLGRGVTDVLQAAEHLKTFPFVDKTRVTVLGFSWGAMVSLLAASPTFAADTRPPGAQLAAAISLYPNCRTPAVPEIVRPDVSIPTLVLMGGEDNETPADLCLPGLQALKQRDAPVDWHVFPNTTHCWDCSDQNGQRWSPPWAGGRTVVYLYDSKVTDQSAERAFEFLSRHLKIELKK